MQGEFPRSVLVIQTAFIGDVVLIVPLLEVIKNKWPDCDLDVLVRPPGDNLLETHPVIRNLIVYDKRSTERGFADFFKLANRLKRERYDLALLPHRSFRSGFLAYSAAIPGRIGFKRGGGRFFHTNAIPYPRKTHEIERNLALLSPFGSIPSPNRFSIVATEDDIRFVDAALAGCEGCKLIALAPGSVWFTKRWPEEFFIELGRKFDSQDFRIALIGDKNDKNLCGRIAAAIGNSCVNLAGETTLRQSVEILRRYDILITNDSAPTHLGTAAGTRVLTLFGSTAPEFGFAPFGPKGRALGIELYCRPCTDHGRRRCPEEHFRCMNELTPERVFDEIIDMLTVIPA